MFILERPGFTLTKSFYITFAVILIVLRGRSGMVGCTAHHADSL